MKKIAFIISAASPESEDGYMSRLRDKYRPVFQELLLRGLEGRLEAYDSEERVDWSQYRMLIPSPALEYANNYPALLAWVANMETARIAAIECLIFNSLSLQ